MIRYDRVTLDNGLNIVGEFNDGAQSMAAGYFVRTGSRDETDRISGCSHFLEHMMFKGSNRRSADDVNPEFDVEKNVILEEIALYQDRPQFTVMDDARAAFYGGHPLGNSVLGTTASIQVLQRDQMQEYFSRRYS